jgi:hypothetical protein
MNLLNLIEDQTTGYDNLRALMRAVDTSSKAVLNLGGETVTLEYPEARFMMGKYKAYNKVGRQEEFLRDLGDPVQFDLHMKQLRDLIQKQKQFRGSVPGQRGVLGDTFPGQLEEITQPVSSKRDPINIGMLNWTRMLRAFDDNRPTVDLEFDGQGQPLTVYRPQMQALFLRAKKMTSQQQRDLIQKLADRFETIQYIDQLRRKGMIPTKPAYNKPETDPGQMDLPFEAKKKESDELDRDTAIDPKVQRAFQLARGRQAAAGSDFEAFVKDEIQRTAEIEQELQQVKADNQEQAQQINKLSAAVTKAAKAEPVPVAPKIAPPAPAAAPTPAEPVAAEPKQEPAEPEVKPEPVPQPVPQRQPRQTAEPVPVPQAEPDTKVQVPEPKVRPKGADIIPFPSLELPGTDIDQIEKRRRRKAAESVEITAGEFQGRRATIIESRRNFVTVDIEGFGRHVIHESRVAETQVDINRIDTDRPILPSGAAKLKYAADHNMYDDARIQESLRPGEYHVATVTLDNGDVKKFKVTFDEGYTDVIKDFYAKQGRTVQKIDMDWSVHGPMNEKQDACYHKVRSRYKVWPSAYASGALVQCRKKGAANWGEGGKKKK